MDKEEFLKILNDNITDFNKKVKFIFISPSSRIECYLTSIGYTANVAYLSNYILPILDEANKHLIRGMIDNLINFSGRIISFLIYLNKSRDIQKGFHFISNKITVNETDNFIEIILNEE